MIKTSRITFVILAAIAFSAGVEAQQYVGTSRITPQERGASLVTGVSPLEMARGYYCFTCHAIDEKIVGPAWMDVAARYRNDASAENKLVKKVSEGGNGVWESEVAMPGFAGFAKETDIRTLVRFILSLK